MKTSIRNKKGFTIVELVIVIAVIAILAAVLIPTFVSLVNKANVSADLQLVRNLNTALTLDKTENGKHDTMHDAVHALDDYGYDVTKLYKTISEGNMLLWDSVNDVFCLYNGTDECISYYPDEVENKPTDTETYKYFAIYETIPEEQIYSIYYIGTGKTGEGDEQKNDTATVEVGFDAGHTQINVTYTGENEVTIRMYGGVLSLNAKGAVVTVCGFVGGLDEKMDGCATLVAAKGTQFHYEKAAVESYQTDYGHFSYVDQGAEYACHLFGENNEYDTCIVKDCTQSNPNHIHVYGNYEIDPNPKEIADGDEKKYEYTIKLICAVCGKVYDTFTITLDEKLAIVEKEGETIIIDKTCAHEGTMQDGETKTATCTTPGYTTKYCTNCGHTVVTPIAALGHDWEEHEGKAATCTEDGYTAYKICKREGCAHNVTDASVAYGYVIINAKGHTEGEYTADDNGQHSNKCSVCGNKIGKTEEDHIMLIAADGSAKCATCDYTVKKEDLNDTVKLVIELNAKLGNATHSTMHDALCAATGVGTATLNDVKELCQRMRKVEDTYTKIVWDQTIDKFVVVYKNDDSVKVLYTYDGGLTVKTERKWYVKGADAYVYKQTEYYTRDYGSTQFWYPYFGSNEINTVITDASKQLFSIYYADNAVVDLSNAKLYCGFDMGFYVPEARICLTQLGGNDDYIIIMRTNCQGFNQDWLTNSSLADNVSSKIVINADQEIHHYGDIHAVQYSSTKLSVYYEHGDIKGVRLTTISDALKKQINTNPHKFYTKKDGSTFSELGMYIVSGSCDQIGDYIKILKFDE